jgi:hypothetical protein
MESTNFFTWTFCKNIFVVFLNSPYRETPKHVLKQNQEKKVGRYPPRSWRSLQSILHFLSFFSSPLVLGISAKHVAYFLFLESADGGRSEINSEALERTRVAERIALDVVVPTAVFNVFPHPLLLLAQGGYPSPSPFRVRCPSSVFTSPVRFLRVQSESDRPAGPGVRVRVRVRPAGGPGSPSPGRSPASQQAWESESGQSESESG